MMRKRLCNKKLRSDCGRSARRTAFSLAELVVAIGILVLMLSLAGQVFNLTMQSTGQAKALTAVSQLLRVFERTIREDLGNVQPGQSLILIQGNPVNAYWTQEGMEADNDGEPSTGYPHRSDPAREGQDGEMIKPRADILMIFTARKATSFIYPGVMSSLQQVVYGHAELDEYVPTGDDPPYEFQEGLPAFPVDTSNNNYPSPTLVSPVPAERWHLARRGVLLLPTDAPPGGPDPPVTLLDDPQLLGDERADIPNFTFTDVVGNFSLEEQMLKPGSASPWYRPAIFAGGVVPHARSRLDPTPPALLAERLGAYFLPNCASFKVEWTLDPRSEFVASRLDGTKEIYWFDPGFVPDDPNDPKDPLAELEAAAGKCDEPPKDQRLWSLMCDRTYHPDSGPPPYEWPYSLADRFRGQKLQGELGDIADPNLPIWKELAPDQRPNLTVFGAARREWGTNEIVPEDIFPGALRITVDVFDSERRLDRPIRHVMVVPVGG